MNTNATQDYNDCIQHVIIYNVQAAQIRAEQANINCNVSITNVSGQNATTVQMAQSKVNAQMTTDIQNHFESDIDKTINQTNTDLNFMQFNSSTERTTVSQEIRNQITQAISNSSSNLQSSFAGNNQVINFNNSGTINCQGCPAGATTGSALSATNLPGCTLSVSNQDIQTIL